MIETGQPAPPVRLPDQHGQMVDIGDLIGRAVVLYFYPRDEGRGCTIQACDIRDRWSAFVDRGAAVFGISADDVASHARFAATHDLPHVLLSDPERRVIDAYDSWGWRTGRDGRQLLGVQRNTVLIGPDGRVAGHWQEVDPGAHAEQILAAIDALAG